MPRKRKDPEEPGVTKPEQEALAEGSTAKLSARSRTAKSPSGKVTDGAKKSRSRQTTAAPQEPANIRTESAAVRQWPAQQAPIRLAPVPTFQPESSDADPQLAKADLSSAVSLQEQIALLAYSYWEARGRQPGNPEEDWLRAEREILSRSPFAKR